MKAILLRTFVARTLNDARCRIVDKPEGLVIVDEQGTAITTAFKNRKSLNAYVKNYSSIFIHRRRLA